MHTNETGSLWRGPAKRKKCGALRNIMSLDWVHKRNSQLAARRGVAQRKKGFALRNRMSLDWVHTNEIGRLRCGSAKRKKFSALRNRMSLDWVHKRNSQLVTGLSYHDEKEMRSRRYTAKYNEP